MNTSEFFEILGFLANPARHCKLDAEMHSRSRQGFESRYITLSGETPQSDDRNYYILHDDADKWGVELRIYFDGNKPSLPQPIQPMAVSSRPGGVHGLRINNNDLIWDLIEYGFLLGDTQDDGRIRSGVPAEYMDDFDRGFSI